MKNVWNDEDMVIIVTCTRAVHPFKSFNFSLKTICTHKLNDKCLKLGIGRRVWATIRCFCRGTSILTHQSISGYGSGRHIQPKHTQTGCVCWCSSEKNTLVESRRNISRVTPLFSRLPPNETPSARAVHRLRLLPVSSKLQTGLSECFRHRPWY